MEHFSFTIDTSHYGLDMDNIMTKAGYSVFIARKSLQGVIGYLSYVAPMLHELKLTSTTSNSLWLLTQLQIGLYGGYTLLFSATAAWRLRNIWMQQGKYANKPKTLHQKISTTVFSSTQIATDIAAFTATLLISLDALNLMSPLSMVIYLANSGVNLAKYGYKLGKLMLDDTQSPDKVKATHYSINLGFSLVMSTALTCFFTLPHPINLIVYLSIVSAHSIGKIIYTYYGKERLKSHFNQNIEQNTQITENYSALRHSYTKLFSENCTDHLIENSIRIQPSK